MKTINRNLREGNILKKTMYTIAILSIAATVLCAAFYLFLENSIVLSLTITMGTIAYHFSMRLFVGYTINSIMKNKANYKLQWFQPRACENRLYKKLNVRKWKKYIPTYSPERFDRCIHSWEEVIQASCQAEIVHEVIVLLSFAPILLSKWFGAVLVFIITSVVAAFVDMIFVIFLRYNRQRMVRFISR